MQFDDYGALSASHKLVLSNEGRSYEIPALSVAFGAKIDLIVSGVVPDDMPRAEFLRGVLGDAYDRMVEAGEPEGFAELCAQTAFAYARFGDESAAAVWKRGPQSPEALAAQGAAIEDKTREIVTDAARKTRSRAGTSGTRSRKPSAARKSPGPKSSKSNA